MKKIHLLLIISLCVSHFAIAQDTTSTSSYTEAYEAKFRNVNTDLATTGYVYDRVSPLADLLQVEDNDTTSFSHFRQAYSEIQRSMVNKTFDKNDWSYRYFTDYCKSSFYQDKIPVMGIYTTINYIDSAAFRDGRLLQDPQGLWYNVGNPFASKEIVLGAICNYNVFETDKEYLFSYEPDLNIGNVTEIVIFDLTEGKTYTLNNENKTLPLLFSIEGIHSFSISMSSEEGIISTFTQQFNVKLSTSISVINQCSSPIPPFTVNADIAHLGLKGKGQYRIFYATNHPCDRILRKPIIVSDAWDPQDKRNFVDLIQRLDYYKLGAIPNDIANLGMELRAMGYDIVVLNYPNWKVSSIVLNTPGFPITIDDYNDGGTDYIERNGYVMVKLIQEVNALKVGSEPLVVIGPSMGGQITKYALRYMEQQDALGVLNMKHNARLWVSFDSPNEGANILPGVQDLLWFFAVKQEGEDAKTFVREQLLRPGGQQMLIHSIAETETLKNQYLTGGVNPMFTAWYNKINTMGLPQTCRNIAVANGTFNGGIYHLPASKMFNFKLKTKKTGIRLVKGDVFYMNTSTSSLVNLQVSLSPNYLTQSTSNTGYGALDGSQGGMYDVQKELYESFESSTIGLPPPLGYGKFEIENKTYNSCFIPTVSALQLNTLPNNWTSAFNPDGKVCQGKTPFDNIYASSYNMPHVSIDEKLAQWILQEIQYGQPNCPTICATQFNGIGSRLCPNQQTTVTLNNSLPANTGITWELSSGLVAQSATTGNPYLNVKSTGYNNEAWVRATLTPKNNNGEQCGASSVVNYVFISGNGGSLSMSSTDQCNYIAEFNTHVQGNTYEWKKGTGSYYSSGSDPSSYSAIDLQKSADMGVIVYCKVTNGCGTVYFNKYFLPYSSPNSPQCPVSGKLKQKEDNIFEAEIFPNPTSNSWTVQLPKYLDNAFTFILYDINGRVVYLKENVSLENSNYYLDGSKLSKGVYLLKIKDKNKQEHQYKLVKN